MTGRILTALSVAVAALAPMPVVAQPDAERWTLHRTPWGDPDMQGVWSFATITPLERPPDAGAREELTGNEVDQLNLNARTRNDRTPRTGSTGTYNAFWWDRGESIGRTSLIIAPADGRIPRLTPGGAGTGGGPRRREDAAQRRRVMGGSPARRTVHPVPPPAAPADRLQQPLPDLSDPRIRGVAHRDDPPGARHPA